MAQGSAGKVRVRAPGWKLTELSIAPTRRGDAAVDDFVSRLAERGQWQPLHAADISAMERRGPETTAVEIEADVEAGVAHVLLARHPSGAITYHFPVMSEQRRGARGAAGSTLRFQLPISQEPIAGERRGIVGKVVRTVLLKFAGKIADKTVPLLGLAFEKLEWKARGLTEGVKLVSRQALAAPKPKLPQVTDPRLFSTDPAQPNLLFVHGTFSDTVGAFKELAISGGGTFFDLARPVYGDRMFGLDHFTISRSPADNAKALLDWLPAGPCTFDVITHSRGGLVLRNLVELMKSPKFKLRRAVLVASPNEGTPLASPKRFDVFVTWLSNLLDIFPDNPFTTGLSFVSEGLGWIAHHIVGALPGLAAMDSAGADVAALEGSPVPVESYSALVANFEPDRNLLARIADAGVDVFFGSANDLVVPTEGGWREAPGTAPLSPGGRIGCFGRGGNLRAQVNHLSFFDKPETVTFLAAALSGSVQTFGAIDPAKDLPFLLRRGATLAAAAGAPAGAVVPAGITAPAPAIPTTVPGQEVEPQPLAIAVPAARAQIDAATGDEVFYLSILAPNRGHSPAMLLARFRNASAMEVMYRGEKDIFSGEEDQVPSNKRAQTRPVPKNDEDQKALDAGLRWKRIISVQRRIQRYVNGDAKVKELPDSKTLIQLGTDLFEALFPGEIRRLYDGARAVQPGGRLNVVFTSQVSWMADLPWEFVYDPNRKTFLATSEINFTRNVITAIPAERGEALNRKLRILVIVAQPLGMAHLSVDEEADVIRSGFRRLTEAGIADIDVLLDATPALVHRTLELIDYDIVHFIGHGEYDDKSDTGVLFFESEDGRERTQLDSDVLQQIICRRGIRLLMLNACETGRGGIADFNRGVAPALVAGGVPAVVANQYSVLDVSATAFARHFYWALGQGQTLGDAAREARVAVNYSISGEAIDWAVPVVFARNPAERIISQRTAVRVDREKPIRGRPGTRRSAKRMQVALWDVQRMIPKLEEICDKLTSVQPCFDLRVIHLTAPLGTWRVEKSDGKGKAYLIAEHVSDRLRDKPREFGVDRLIAITNLPLKSARRSDLQVWEDRDANIAILSIYGFLELLAPPEYTIEHLITNVVTTSLSVLTNHKTGAKNCLLYDNPPADPSIAGRLSLCKLCKKRLQKRPEEIQWIEAMLAAYP